MHEGLGFESLYVDCSIIFLCSHGSCQLFIFPNLISFYLNNCLLKCLFNPIAISVLSMLSHDKRLGFANLLFLRAYPGVTGFRWTHALFSKSYIQVCFFCKKYLNYRCMNIHSKYHKMLCADNGAYLSNWCYKFWFFISCFIFLSKIW